MAHEYAEALGRPVEYVDMPFDQWRDQVLKVSSLPAHVLEHFKTMAQLHADNRYDHLTDDVTKVNGQPPMSVRDFVAGHLDVFQKGACERIH